MPAGSPHRRRTAKASSGTPAKQSENEDIRVRVWDAEDAIQAAFAGCFTNSVTAIGLFWLASKRDWLRQKWMTA